MCYAHFGRAESSHRMLKRERVQLLLWEKLIREEVTKGDHRLTERCMERLWREDSELKAFNAMSSADQKREKFFMGNSIKGYLEFLQRSGP
jgi:hypothetical protein